MKNGNAHPIDIPAKVFWYVENGRSYGQTAEALNMPKATVYKTYLREKQRRETFTETTGNEVETTGNDQTENANVAPEKPFTPVSKPLQSVSFWREWRDAFHPADLLYYLAVSLAAVGIVNALGLVGYPVAVLFCSGAFIALHGIKTATGWNRLPHFAIMAVIEAGSFVAHMVWANTALWQGVKGLPLDIWEYHYTVPGYGLVEEWHGEDLAVPGKIAIGIAAFMLACTVYVCWLAVQNSIQNSKPKQ